MELHGNPPSNANELFHYPLSQNDYRQEKYFRIIFGGSTGKSCKSPGGYYIIKFLGNYFSHPIRAPFLRSLSGSGTETGGGGSYRTGALTGKNVWGIFSGALHKNPVLAPGQLHKIIFTDLFW